MSVVWVTFVAWKSSASWTSAVTSSMLSFIDIRSIRGVFLLVPCTKIQELLTSGRYQSWQACHPAALRNLVPLTHAHASERTGVGRRAVFMFKITEHECGNDVDCWHPAPCEKQPSNELDYQWRSRRGWLPFNDNELNCRWLNRGGSLLPLLITCSFCYCSDGYHVASAVRCKLSCCVAAIFTVGLTTILLSMLSVLRTRVSGHPTSVGAFLNRMGSSFQAYALENYSS